MKGATHRIPGLVVTEHEFEAPLDHARAGGETISVFAREVVAAAKENATLPWLVFLQGGPGGMSPRPSESSGWVKRATEEYRVCLLDQRGTGRSSPFDVQSLARFPPAEQAAYLKHFRADAIVADAELVRQELAGGEPWAALGQSYGGFVLCTYLSFAPEGLREGFVTAGLPPLERSAEDVYRATFERQRVQNRRYYERYPEDVERVRRIARHLAENEVLLPGGDRLSPRRFRQQGQGFGMSDGFESLHYLVERAWIGDELGLGFLRDLESDAYAGGPIYAILHESIYAQGEATRWAAQRVLDEQPDFDGDDPFLFTGETIFPWMFDEYRFLRPLKEAAELLAADEDWPPLYDVARLRENTVPVAAAIWTDDPYVERELSEETAQTIGARTWVTNEYLHNALRADGERVLGRLIGMVRGEA